MLAPVNEAGLIFPTHRICHLTSPLFSPDAKQYKEVPQPRFSSSPPSPPPYLLEPQDRAKNFPPFPLSFWPILTKPYLPLPFYNGGFSHYPNPLKLFFFHFLAPFATPPLGSIMPPFSSPTGRSLSPHTTRLFSTQPPQFARRPNKTPSWDVLDPPKT